MIGAGSATRWTRALKVSLRVSALVMSEDGAPRAKGRSAKMVVESEKRIWAVLVAVVVKFGRPEE